MAKSEAIKIVDNAGFTLVQGYKNKFERGNMVVCLMDNGWSFDGQSQRDDNEIVQGSYSFNGLSELESLIRNGLFAMREAQYANVKQLRRDWAWIDRMGENDSE